MRSSSSISRRNRCLRRAAPGNSRCARRARERIAQALQAHNPAREIGRAPRPSSRSAATFRRAALATGREGAGALPAGGRNPARPRARSDACAAATASRRTRSGKVIRSVTQMSRANANQDARRAMARFESTVGSARPLIADLSTGVTAVIAARSPVPVSDSHLAFAQPNRFAGLVDWHRPASIWPLGSSQKITHRRLCAITTKPFVALRSPWCWRARVVNVIRDQRQRSGFDVSVVRDTRIDFQPALAACQSECRGTGGSRCVIRVRPGHSEAA